MDLLSTMTWHFWLDVGGTFTDCLARGPQGQLVRQKVLSSGITKGQVGTGSTPEVLFDLARTGDAPDFWRGYRCTLLDSHGQPVEQVEVERFDARRGGLHLRSPLQHLPRAGQAYELSSNEEAVLLALRQILRLRRDEPLPSVNVRLGTTRGTNALLTRRGAKTALVTTRGFADALRIGYQHRPDLFALDIVKPQPLFTSVVEVDERVTAGGEVLVAPNQAQVLAQLQTLREQGIESLAICLLHAALYPQHEQQVAAWARAAGWQNVVLSSETAPLGKLVARGETTVLDAYLNPVLGDYLQQLQHQLGSRASLRLMTSAGGLVSPGHFTGKDSILSGPAGGVVGYAQAAKQAGFSSAIGFDMGGTSTDVSRYDGRFQLEYETRKAGVQVVAPVLAIETVAAGGGSICRFDGVKLVVGPDSAGANPGPACYGRGGPLSVTDLNLCLGRLLSERFPFPLDRAAVEQRLAAVAHEIHTATGHQYTLPALAEGFLQIANQHMVRAIRSISVAQGYDPRGYLLVAFGGAAGQHACAVARELGVPQVLSSADAGILSAVGIGQAELVRHREQSLYRPLDAATLADVQQLFTTLVDNAQAEVLAEGISAAQTTVRRTLDLRYVGLEAILSIEAPSAADDPVAYRAAYEAEHQRLYGYTRPQQALEVVTLRAAVTGQLPALEMPHTASVPRAAIPVCTRTAYFNGQPTATAFFERNKLQPGDWFVGPAIVGEALATTVIEPGWRAELLPHGELLLTDQGGASQVQASAADAHIAADPVLLEVFHHQFAGIAEQMGHTLRNTSTSVNVKERLDFSCALFTPAGELVVNAPHIPVHLGAMGLTVRAVIANHPDLQPGDVVVTNDPYQGGSHLPDVTVVTPVHDPATGELRLFTASRAHHADIGGIAPGSMPPFSKNLAEEGVLIRSRKLVSAGVPQLESFRELLQSGPYPTRQLQQNLADVQAQVAANQQGAQQFLALIERVGWPLVSAYMRHIRTAAETKLRLALAKLTPGRLAFCDHLDDGTPICVAVTITGDQAVIDFTGSGPQVVGNLNANRAIVTAAVLYCLRLLVDEDFPLNEGVLAAVELIIPPGVLNPQPGPTPETSPAVVGGNVETSQRVVDVVLGAFGLAAASQGTMNNLTFGDATFGYYETICGGAGATSRAAGADAVHTHMTNTRLTDPEVLERRYPVRLLEFAIRHGSGGAGQHPGGAGVRRTIEFLRPLTVSLLTQRRGPYAPYGAAGGSPGALGQHTLKQADGRSEQLPGCVRLEVQPGAVLTIETPGGGGWGRPE